MSDIKVGNTVKVGFSLQGEVVSIVHKPWGPVAVIRGSGLNRQVPLSSCTKI